MPAGSLRVGVGFGGKLRSMTRNRILALMVVGVALGAALPSLAQEDNGYPIAGLQPSERPAGAPVITEFEKDAAWYAEVLRGISEPYPASLRFLEDEGAWYTPFIHPGMTGPYDIRGWHSGASEAATPLATAATQ